MGPMRRRRLRLFLQRLSSQASKDEKGISDLQWDPLCKNKQHAHELYVQEKELPKSYLTEDVCCVTNTSTNTSTNSSSRVESCRVTSHPSKLWNMDYTS